MEFSEENIKPGMKVKIKNRRGSIWNIYGDMDYLKGAVVEIKEVYESHFEIEKRIGYGAWTLEYDDIERIVYDKFTKADLQNGDILTDGDGDISVYLEGELIGNTLGLDDLDPELKGCKVPVNIVKIERPVKLETIWERQENETVEMTVEEIEEKLGIQKGKLRVKGVKE